MTESEMKAWIDRATYQQLLQRWRFEPSGSPWFAGELGQYYAEAMRRKRDATPQGAQVAASKAIGWEQ